MKKIFMMTMALLFSLISVNAQTAIETPKFFDNWYVGVGGQVTTPLDFYSVFPLNGGPAVVIGKQITPVFGFNFEDDVWFTSHANGNTRFDHPFNHNVVRGNYLGLNGTMNLMNLFAGYKGSPRLFEIETVVGLGWWHVFTPNASDKSRNDLAAKTGLNFNFNLGQKKAHSIYIQPAVLWNLTNPACEHHNVAFNKMGAHLALQAGYVYHFKTSNGTHNFKTYDVGAMFNEIDALKAELARKPREVIREVQVEKVVEKQIISPIYVSFAKGSYELTDDAKNILDKVKGSVSIVATASPEGTEEFNQTLSENRAKAVAEYLKNNKVTIVSEKGLGVQGDASQRVAIITQQ